MLTVQEQKRLLAALKISAEDIAEMVDGTDEATVDVSTLKIYDEAAYTTLVENLKKSSKEKHINDGKEIAVKNMKEQLGLEYDGKDPKVFLDKYKEHILSEAKLAPDAKDQQIATLQQSVTEWKGKHDTAVAEKGLLARDSEWLMKLPKDRNDTMSDEDRMLLLKNKLQADEQDGKTTYKYKGRALVDDLTNPLSLDEAFEVVFKEEKWIGTGDKVAKGRGGNSSKATEGKALKASEVAAKYVDETGKKATGAEYQAYLNKAIKDNPDLDLQA